MEELGQRLLPSAFPPLDGPTNPPAAANAVAFQVVNGETEILVAGYDTVNGTEDFALWRYHSNGTLDTSFGQNGLVTTDFGRGSATATALAIDLTTGDIVEGGYASDGPYGIVAFGVAVYDANGNPVSQFGSNGTSFGPAGTVTTEFGSGDAEISALAIDATTHQIVVGGYAQDSTTGNWGFALARYNFDGSLDSSFGVGTGSFGPAGTVTTEFGPYAEAGALLIDPAGRYVVGGFADKSNGSNLDFALARYTSQGTLDTSFGAGSGGFGPAGTVTTDFGLGSAHVTALAVNASGQYIAAGYAFNANTSDYDFALGRYNGDGSLDTSFGGGNSFGPAGTVTTDFGSTDAYATALAIVPGTQRIVVGGYAYNGANWNADFALARYSANGSLDSTFGGSGSTFGPAGTVTVDFGAGGYAQVNALAIDPGGNYIAAGYAVNSTTFNDNLAAARITPSGNLDSTFGANTTSFGPAGTITWQPAGSVAWSPLPPPSSPDTAANAVVVQQVNGSSNVLVGGYTTHNGNQVFALWRYTSSGTLDPSFGQSGLVTTDFGPGQGWDQAQITALTIDPTTGDIVAAGYAENSVTSAFDFAVAVYLPNGTPMTLFGYRGTSLGPGGTVTTDFGGDAQATGVAVDATRHQIVVAGYAWNGTSGYSNFALARYNFDGSLDTAFGAGSGSFGPAGTVTTDFGAGAQANGLVIDTAGNYVAGGTAENLATGNMDFALARYTASGSLDTTFGVGTGSFGPAGTVTTDFGTGDAQAFALAVNASGQYVVAGYAQSNTTYNDDLALARYNANGTLDSSFRSGFGPAGTVTTDFGSPYAFGNAVAIVGSTQQIVAGGYALSPATGNFDFVVARYNTSGTLDSTFGTPGTTFGPAGTVTVDFGAGGAAQVNALAIDLSGNYLAAGSAASPTNFYNSLAVARLTPAGALDSSFGAGTGSFGPAGTVTWQPAFQPPGSVSFHQSDTAAPVVLPSSSASTLPIMPGDAHLLGLLHNDGSLIGLSLGSLPTPISATGESAIALPGILEVNGGHSPDSGTSAGPDDDNSLPQLDPSEADPGPANPAPADTTPEEGYDAARPQAGLAAGPLVDDPESC